MPCERGQVGVRSDTTMSSCTHTHTHTHTHTQVPVFGGVYHLDIVLSSGNGEVGGGQCIAIEVDGPSHFVQLARPGRGFSFFFLGFKWMPATLCSLYAWAEI